jgi:hypothetical protein
VPGEHELLGQPIEVVHLGAPLGAAAGALLGSVLAAPLGV